MDGAIILSRDAKRILVANAHLTPDPKIPTVETGSRHRTAERVARQTGELVISISQRRNVITLYRGTMRYILQDVGVLLTKANQALSTLERYKSVLEQALINLSAWSLRTWRPWETSSRAYSGRRWCLASPGRSSATSLNWAMRGGWSACSWTS